MKVRLMRVYNEFQKRYVWVPRELYETNFATHCVARENSWIRHSINMADKFNTAERVNGPAQC